MTESEREHQSGERIDLAGAGRLPSLPVLPLPGEVVLRRTADELVDALAADLMVAALACVRQFGDFHLALSGGGTPQPLYERLMYCPTYRALPWKATHLWIVDERCVDPRSDHSNFRMIQETIIEHSDVPADQAHAIDALSPHADLEYEKQIRETLCWRPKHEGRMDFVLLGMGADGHTASLFPGAEALQETQRLAMFADAPGTVAPKRVTMTYRLINDARVVAVLITGSSKAAAVRRLIEGREPVERMPIKGVRPTRGELRWYLDLAAAGSA